MKVVLPYTPRKQQHYVHTELAKYILSLGFFVDAVSEFNFPVVRPNIRDLDKNEELNVDTIIKHLRLWDENNIK